MEVTLEELQQMLKDGKISNQQFTKIMIDNFGEKKVMSALQETMEEVYGKDVLTKPLPPSIKETFGV